MVRSFTDSGVLIAASRGNSFRSQVTFELGDRLQTLLEQKKVNILTPKETLEFAAIGELDEIVRYVNTVNASL
jgi:hypothetical protein